MNFLFDNPLANMSGPVFLVLYGALIAVLTIVIVRMKPKLDWTSNLPPALVPSTPDPFEIAYLRGGANELARAVIFSLTQKGFLQITHEEEKSYIQLMQNSPNWTVLSPIERESLKWFQVKRETSEAFENYGLVAKLESYSAIYEQKMIENNFLTPANVASKTRNLSFFFFGIVAIFGAYKLVSALVNGKSNVIFLLLFALIALAIFALARKTKRLSKHGERYIESIQSSFEKLRNIRTTPVAETNHFTVDPNLLALGLFGTTVLSTTIYDDYTRAFHRSNATTGGSSCGSSCGAGSDGGSDGGGCGGGGCGGGD